MNYFKIISIKFLLSIAVILGPDTLRHFLINYARPFIFSTYMPFSSLALVKTAYKQLESEEISKVNVMTFLNIPFANFSSTFFLRYSTPVSIAFAKNHTSFSRRSITTNR